MRCKPLLSPRFAMFALASLCSAGALLRGAGRPQGVYDVRTPREVSLDTSASRIVVILNQICANGLFGPVTLADPDSAAISMAKQFSNVFTHVFDLFLRRVIFYFWEWGLVMFYDLLCLQL